MGLMRIAGFAFVSVLVLAAACDAKMPNKCQADEQCPEGAYCDEGRALCFLACEKAGCLEGHFCDLGTHACNPWVPLESLTTSAGTLVPAFTAEVTSYSAAVAYAVDSLTVTPTAGDERWTITVNSVTVKSGEASQAITLEVGRNEFEVIVTAVSGITKKAYALSVYRLGAGWVLITPGTEPYPSQFTMGSPKEEALGDEDEVQHEVTLTHSFAILSTEVTQAEYEALMGPQTSFFDTCADCPVEEVSWHEAAAYCNALSKSHPGGALQECYTCTGTLPDVTCTPIGNPYECLGYRLPTEAEWEYAARAGTQTATYKGNLDVTGGESSVVLDPIAWYYGNSGDSNGINRKTHVVATKDPNDWGLYDMLGNVSEWCHDWYDPYDLTNLTDPWGPPIFPEGSGRVFRGGSWNYDAGDVRAAFRNVVGPGSRDDDLGLRPVRSLP